jgi:hypothetical protein
MKFIKLFLFFTLFILTANLASAQYKSNFYVEGELLVKFKNGTASEFARTVNDQIGASVLEEFPDLKWQRIKLPEGLSIREATAHYENLAEVEYVQPNYYYRLLITPNDPQFPNNLYGLGKISAPSAWDLSTGSSNIVVADIDTGMRYTHEDLAANAWTNPSEAAGTTGVDDLTTITTALLTIFTAGIFSTTMPIRWTTRPASADTERTLPERSARSATTRKAWSA